MGLITLKGAGSDYIIDNLIRFQFNDDTSDKIDQLSMTFNAQRLTSVPPYGAEYVVYIHGVSRGSWSVVGRSVDHLDVMSIKLSPVTKGSTIKERATKSYQSKTIKDIVEDVVAPHGYTVSISASLAQKVVHQYRNNETAGDFLNRIALEYGAISKPVNKVWQFKHKADVTNEKGKPKPTVIINSESRIISASVSGAGGDTYNGVKVSYWCEDKSERVQIVKGSAPFNDRGQHPKSKAIEIAESYQQYNKNAKENATVTLPSSEVIVGMAFAQGVIKLERGRFMQGTFIIDSVAVNERTTTIQASLPK